MTPRLIVMLTHNDMTVGNAEEVLDQCLSSRASCFGFKEKPLALEQMQRMTRKVKSAGKTSFLEVVAYTEEEGLAGAQTAIDCGVDTLMGTVYSPRIQQLCHDHGLKYMPFVGKLEGRPTVLGGSIEEIVAEARHHLAQGADGIDLLGYRHGTSPERLVSEFSRQVEAPVVVAGSINSVERLDQVKQAAPWGFTIGSAFFEHCFGDSFFEQVNFVVDHIEHK